MVICPLGGHLDDIFLKGKLLFCDWDLLIRDGTGKKQCWKGEGKGEG